MDICEGDEWVRNNSIVNKNSKYIMAANHGRQLMFSNCYIFNYFETYSFDIKMTKHSANPNYIFVSNAGFSSLSKLQTSQN